ncbi:MAG: hypothetical protein Q4D14_04360 [Bacteroidales bacterium]|nr:hypothetical protein [Bacteroidales bacterium]
MTAETINYILLWLCRGNQSLRDNIGYCSWADRELQHRIIIEPAASFIPGVLERHPADPAPLFFDVPLLYGTPKYEQRGDCIYLQADIVASTFYLLSRYNELHDTNAVDHLGRATAKGSWMERNNALLSPLADSYANILHSLFVMIGISTEQPPQQFAKVVFTHDADILTAYRRPRGVIGSLLRRKPLKQMIRAWQDITLDPAFTFQNLFQQDQTITNSEIILFIKSLTTLPHQLDLPTYALRHKDTQTLLQLAKENNVTIGLHASFCTGKKTELIEKEANKLRCCCKHIEIKSIRHHYLNLPHPEAIYSYANNGLSDDYSVGFADHIGFRLGTSHPVRRITPLSQVITNDILHPLLIMDVSLSNEQYMHCSIDEANEKIEQVMKAVAKHNGEMVLLWHNTSMMESYHAQLYPQMLQLIKKYQS